jgi:DNA-directed RNA polymerase subunit RPC12/RpoP
MIVDYLVCSICGKQIEEDPHTSLPVSNGYCCSRCYKEVVKPRVDHFFDELNKIKV